MAEGVIDGEPDEAGRDELEDEQQQEDLAEFVPVPVGAREEVIDGGVVAEAVQDGGLPDLGEGARTQANDPGLGDVAEVVEGLLAEAGSEVA